MKGPEERQAGKADEKKIDNSGGNGHCLKSENLLNSR